MSKHYEHTQVGYVMIFSLGAALLLTAGLTVSLGFDWGPIIVMAVLLLCTLAFSKLTVTVEDNTLTMRMGIGVIQKKIQLKDIESFEVRTNPWYYGWGIHLTPHGWLYNVSGFNAVKITMKSGKSFLIGTDDEANLSNFLGELIKK